MALVYFSDMPSYERTLLMDLGFTENSKGFNFTNENQWEWIDSLNQGHLIIEHTQLITFSTNSVSEDEFYFCRIKMNDRNEYVYLIDSSFSADTFVLGGVGNPDIQTALKTLNRIISFQDWRVPSKIVIHSTFSAGFENVIHLFSLLDYYKEHPEQLEEEIRSCELHVELND